MSGKFNYFKQNDEHTKEEYEYLTEDSVSLYKRIGIFCAITTLSFIFVLAHFSTSFVGIISSIASILIMSMFVYCLSEKAQRLEEGLKEFKVYNEPKPHELNYLADCVVYAAKNSEKEAIEILDSYFKSFMIDHKTEEDLKKIYAKHEELLDILALKLIGLDEKLADSIHSHARIVSGRVWSRYQ